MRLVRDRVNLNKLLTEYNSTALVPTMGCLHFGHVQLIRKAKTLADCVIVVIFVNPAQFSQGEDFQEYPRPVKQDLELLRKENVDLVYMPHEHEMYSNPKTIVSIPEIKSLLCGATRPSFFDGIALIVTKLFFIFRPDFALFGEKDFQQLLLIKTLAKDLSIPVKIESIPIARESNGLAMSSRNMYLSPVEKDLASEIYKSLKYVKLTIETQQPTNYVALIGKQVEHLNLLGLQVDYYKLCNIHDLSEITSQVYDMEARLMVATNIKQCRLIDNIAVYIK